LARWPDSLCATALSSSSISFALVLMLAFSLGRRRNPHGVRKVRDRLSGASPDNRPAVVPGAG
jgi:hypothetical protein